MTRQWLFWLSLGVLFLLFLYLIKSILLPFVVGILAAYFLDPAADRLEKTGLSRNMATAAITAAFFLLVILLCLWIPPVIIDQFAGLVETLPGYINAMSQQYGEKITHWLGALPAAQIENMQKSLSDISGALLRFAGDATLGLFQSGAVIINLLSLLLITPVVTFYLLRDWDALIARINALLPKAHAAVIREQLAIMDRTLAGFVRGQLNVCFLLAAYYGIGLSLVGLKFGLVIGVLTGFLVILPYVGMAFGLILGLGIALFQFDSYFPILMVLAVFVTGQIIEGYFITPKLVGSKVGLHPVWIIFGMLAGAALFGFVGILLAIPVTAVIGVLIRFSLSQYLQSSYYHGAPSRK